MKLSFSGNCCFLHSITFKGGYLPVSLDRSSIRQFLLNHVSMPNLGRKYLFTINQPPTIKINNPSISIIPPSQHFEDLILLRICYHISHHRLCFLRYDNPTLNKSIYLSPSFVKKGESLDQTSPFKPSIIAPASIGNMIS